MEEAPVSLALMAGILIAAGESSPDGTGGGFHRFIAAAVIHRWAAQIRRVVESIMEAIGYVKPAICSPQSFLNGPAKT